MPDNIAGYTNVVYVKGHRFRVAGVPKPVVFTGDIDEISDELLTKAMFVTRGQVGGTLPNDFGLTFLITTYQYGNDTYLQTAHLIQTGYECYEYRRIYSGGWTTWVGVDSAIASVDNKIQSVKDTADNCSQSIQTINTQLSSIKTDINTITGSTIPQLSGTVTSLNDRVRTLENKSALVNVSSNYTVTKTSGAWSFNALEAYKSGNAISMYVQFRGNNSSVSVGSNAFVGKVSGGALPVMYARFISYYASSAIVGDLTPDGDLTVRILGSSLNIQRNTCSISSVFFVNG